MKEPVVTVSDGKLQGKTGTNINNGQFYSFQGIPYAKPPVGSLRFKAPQPPEPWTGVRDATREGCDCIARHPVLTTIIGGEDCLTLNVYTPSLPKQNNCNDLKAVMVWIHGGGFISGSGSSEVYGPDFLLTEDVVLVTINYRLGIFGFLSLDHPDVGVPGNAGLKDMVMALKWVQKNIVHFSGDSNNVTIFGESAGGAATHYLVLSPMAKGLFHRAIIQSGCALNVWAKGSRYVSKLAQVLNIHTTDERNILKILQELPAQEVYLAAEKVPDLFLPCGVRPQGPVIEHKSPEAFLSEYPLDIIRSGQYNHVPIMIGYTTREGMLAEILQKRNPLNAWKDFESAVPNFLALERGSDMSKLIAQRIKEFYYGDEEPFTNNKDKYYLLETDNLFLREMLLTTKRHAETSSVPIFLYRMSIETSLNMMKNIFGIEEPGVCHADDLGYLFKNMLTPNVEPGSEEDIGLKRFVKLWTNFAKFGDPNPKGNDPVIDIKWKPVTKSEINFLDIGKNLITGLNPEAERMRFWEDILKVNPNSKL
jgi:carboxylesterase type B